MSSYGITFYSRDDITFGRASDGSFTVTVKEGATPETIKIVDNDKGDAGERFEGGTGRGANAHQHSQEAYGSSNGTEFNGDPIQPLAALPGAENPDDQIIAIGIGEPTHTIGYGFTYEPVPGETVSFNYSGYDSSPSYDHAALYVEGQEGEPSSTSGSSGTSGASGGSGTSGSSGGKGGSGTSGASGTTGASGSGKGSGASGHGGTSGSSGGNGSSGASGGKGGSGASGGGKNSGASGHSGTSGASGGSGTSGSSGSSGTSGSSGGSGSSGASSPPCFTAGTALRTGRGEVLVEDLIVGDLLWTEAHGLQPIRWIYQREVDAKGSFAPIKITAGTLGADRDILVSPAHRMLLQGADVEVLFGTPKALVAAKDLVNGRTITRETGLSTVEYFHILFDRHEVLEAHGTLSESFFPDPHSIGDVDAAQRKELYALFPEMELAAHGYSIAYPGLMPHEVALLGR